jgi:hypothetical protein
MDERLIAAVDRMRFDAIAETISPVGELSRRAAEAAEAGDEKTVKVLLHMIVRRVRSACVTAGELGTEGAASNYD